MKVDEWWRDQDWVPLYLATIALTMFLVIVAGAGHASDVAPRPDPRAPRHAPTAHPGPGTATSPAVRVPAVLPNGTTRVFGPDDFLVAYYGTAGTGALGVLGDAGPDAIAPRLRRAAAAFGGPGRRVQPVFELIVTLAHRGPGPSGTYNSDIPRAEVRRYIDAAHRDGVLLLLDLQPGTEGFLSVARRWTWALEDPYVGLALDPEWRMSRGGVPGERIGSVDAAEINRVSHWLDALTAAYRLPEKLFVLHQFRTDMIRGIGAVAPRAHLAEVQHVDGFGPPGEKMATFRAVIRPQRFVLGFKLFYTADRPRMRPAQVLAIRPRVRFVSYQ